MYNKFKLINIRIFSIVLFSGLLILPALYSQQSYENKITGFSSDIRLKENSIKINTADDNLYGKNNPQFEFSVLGGYSVPLNEMKGDLSTVSLKNGATSDPSYFEKYGYNYGLHARMSLDKKNMFRVTIAFLANTFMNSGSDSSGNFTIEPELGFTQVAVGAEWVLMRKKEFAPFIGFDVNANIFNGTITFIEDSSGSQISASYNPVTRYGVSGIAGLEYYASKKIGVFVTIKYTMANLFGKNFDATGAHDLNDEAHTVNGVSFKQKNINYLNFSAGVSLLLGN